MTRRIVNTTNAPAAIGTYSQAVVAQNVLYISGQIPLHPVTGELQQQNFGQAVEQVLDNLQNICEVEHATLDDAIKFNVFVTDLANFPAVNEALAARLSQPYPARAVVQVSGLPRGAIVEIDAIVNLPSNPTGT